jgi:glucose-6-phosphate isomerase
MIPEEGLMGDSTMWRRYKDLLYSNDELGLSLDISYMGFAEDFFDKMEPIVQEAYRAMDLLEAGGVANPDENRMVGHYWLRNPAAAPDMDITRAIQSTVAAIKDFVKKIHAGETVSSTGKPFTKMLIIGIGGSALGPQFVASALATVDDPLKPYFFDNTDPDGMDMVLGRIGAALEQTLVIVISKSGGTAETRNGMLEARRAFEKAGLDFAGHAVAITGEDSALDKTATEDGWLSRFPMWDWVGGRFSETSAVGLLPAALQGFDIEALLEGAGACDVFTRDRATGDNPAALLALMWYHATDGQGSRDMVFLPYKDRLQLISRYLQQLIMESLGKGLDLDGNTVNQGITVYGNKGTTDQHAYIQQLREGVNNFFVTFIAVLSDRRGDSPEMDEGVTAGDYLHSFLLGTREALRANGRESLTITIDTVEARSIGLLIALFERAVGYYATLINVNAYHQPGVEAGKKAATKIIALQEKILNFLANNEETFCTAEEVASAIGASENTETVFHLLLHASHNPDHGVEKQEENNSPVTDTRFGIRGNKR